MHISLALVIGLLVAAGVFLVYVALVGVSFVGIGVAGEVELAATLFVVAAIVVVIFAAGFKAQFRRVRTGREALIGATGTVTTTLSPRGEVRVMSEFWEAAAKEGTIAAGQTVEVVGMNGLTLLVKACEQKA